ncbi:MAG: diguanylate cyclase [Campylobacterota bacterium]|nr:diguanylate cyclase [Campylobacterota bacterium]
MSGSFKATALLFLIFIFSSLAIAQDKVSLQLQWKHQFEFAGYYIAKEKGFYKDAGFDVDIIEFELGTDEAFRKASLKGWRYAFEHIEETSNLILQKYNTQNKTKEALIYEANALKKLAYHSTTVLGQIDKDKIQTIYGFYNLLGYTEGKIDLDELIYTPPIEDVNLSYEEKEWIKNNSVKIGLEQWAPVIFSNTGEDIDGICGDFTKTIIEKTGLKVEIVVDDWNKILSDFKTGKIDLIPDTYYNKQRTSFGFFSDSYFKIKDAIYTKSDNNFIHSLKDLEGYRLVIPKGYATIDKIREKFPKIDIIYSKNLEDSINIVLNNEADALYDGQIVVETKIKEELITNLKMIPSKSFKSPSLHYFTSINKPILHSIIQKALATISYQERVDIISKWTDSNLKIKLNEEEQKFIDKNIAVNYLYNPDLKPLEWMSDIGEHKGILSDVVKLIEQKSGLKLEVVKSDPLNNAVTFSSFGMTEQKLQTSNFTEKALLTLPYVFITHIDNEYVKGFDEIKTKNIEVIKNYTIDHILKKDKPNLKYTTVSTLDKAFNRVQDKDTDILIVNALSAKYYIDVLGYKDLKIIYVTELYLDLKIAIANDIPKEVLTIIDKSVNLITEKEMSDISHKWTHLRIKKEIELLASTDPMTKLYNRRYFSETSENILELAKRNSSNLSVMMIDIDFFKNINDTYGHKFGDIVIIKLAEILRDSTRESDIVCRWGGEEFIVLLPETDIDGVYTLATKLNIDTRNTTLTYQNQPFKFTISIGISQVDTQKDKDIEVSINRADIALYEAKESGRDRVCIQGYQ